ncbi:LPXTG cell wall anchor domain-containing protein [Enterococcus mundtii]|uniref:LPXTG cell wall anchor domain-containing protein n=1 Tax=Enterococcus mundtii TaxID=53346 RepID=UPI000824B979|nr:LPXTG cell wall anchor domain-containing protein [Enterococcus mundtii]
MRIIKQLLIIAGIVLVIGFTHSTIVHSSENPTFFKRVEGTIGNPPSPTPSNPSSESNTKNVLVVDASRFPSLTVNLPKTGASQNMRAMYLGFVLVGASFLLFLLNQESQKMKEISK